ncbi:fungal-specific transcription factor domain-containing protein [Penicillium chermesinum]|nr:fungal-specific transcription factor domain-containing protein [Penicillium chermesinum]
MATIGLTFIPQCDLLFPKCSTCEAARAPCLKFDNEKQAEIPRGYVLTLESQVKQLKLEIAELKAEKHNEAGQPGFVCERTDTGYSCSPSSRTTATATTESVTSDPQEMVKSMGLVLLREQQSYAIYGNK